jgi:hypothetical protein
METRELIKALRYQPGNMAFSPQIRREAADKLEQLQRFIDDMLGDHYVDYLEFYANRCMELEEELEQYKNNI